MESICKEKTNFLINQIKKGDICLTSENIYLDTVFNTYIRMMELITYEYILIKVGFERLLLEILLLTVRHVSHFSHFIDHRGINPSN